jgi:hypothetical protein
MRINGPARLVIVIALGAFSWFVWDHTVGYRLLFLLGLDNTASDPTWILPVAIGATGFGLAVGCVGLAIWVGRGFRTRRMSN